ncbi:MAG TPA: CRTAC1 family protein [Gemmataceae bacterium]|jgi:hypothetical protein|nr:CRTAC1 family protein [Gemmataceae bacterium]
MIRRRLVGAFLAILLVAMAACRAKVNQTNISENLQVKPAEPPFFEDITATSGIDFTYRNGEETANHLSILESIGGGVALLDYDGDGLLDVFVTGGGYYAGPDGKTIVGLPCKLYKNLGGGRFQEVTALVGLDRLAGGQPWFYSHGAAVADYDRDGWPDLLVTGWGRLALFHNVPVDPNDPSQGRRFEDVTAAAGLDKGIAWATSAAFGDLDGDGYPDLYVCQYVNWSFANHPKCDYNSKISDVCPPKAFSGLPHKVYRNTGTGKFVDVSDTAGLAAPEPNSSKGLGVLMIDVDGDGKPDIYVANDTTAKFLYLNCSTPGNIRLKEIGMSSGSALDGQGLANGSMGLDAGDYDGSGRPALWVTNYEHEQHGLYRNEARPGGGFSFHFRTQQAGLAQMGQKYVGWGTAFLDVDLDGWEDLFFVNGHAIRYPQGKGMNRKQPPFLYHNLRGKFQDASGQIGSYGATNHLARGVAFGDLDNDGRTDLIISHVNEPVVMLRGIGGADCHWLGVELIGNDHADVVGAKVELQVGQRVLTRFAKGGGSYLSSNDRRLLFGLGHETKPGRLTVTWPDGKKQSIDNLGADRYHAVIQGQSQNHSFPTKK